MLYLDGSPTMKAAVAPISVPPTQLGNPLSETFLGKYRAQRILGEGGMGQVFLGKHIGTGESVVIKVMHDHLAKVPAVRQSFHRELQVMMQFRHPYAVSLLDGAIEGPGRPCLIMEYVPGVTLDQLLERDGRFDARRIGRWLGQLCRVLHVAHGANILHRDLTPANVMVMNVDTPNETIKVMDFGLARFSNAYFIPVEKFNGQSAGIGGGTPDYICPEQIRGEQVDLRADLYSIGVMLYKLFAGVLPFQKYTETNDILAAHVRETPPTFGQLGVTNVPPAIEALIRHLLAKIPAERVGSARELALRFQDASREKIVPETAFQEEIPVMQSSLDQVDPRLVLDRMEAWMPEAIAIMKLRAFAESVQGAIVDSEPGVLRMKIVDPRSLQPAEKKGFTLFGLFRRALPDPKYLTLELHMEKKTVGTRSMVEIAAALERDPMESRADADVREGFAKRIVRELRAYLMIGR
jgi:serine/threonine protein kinase